MRLRDKIGLITAAASGMGRAGALRFAAEGSAVSVVDIDEAAVAETVATIEAAGGRALGLVGDLRDPHFSRDIVTRTVAEFGGLDYAWCHAGHPGPSAIEDVDLELYQLAIDLNLTTLLMTTAAALPELKKRGGGSLLYTSSTAGLRGSTLSPIYSMMKFGVIGFMRSLAARHAKDNIRVNAICPGSMPTPMLRGFFQRPDDAGARALDVEETIVERAAKLPMGRMGTPEEVAATALFLVSDEASYVSGQSLGVDGALVA